MPVMLKKFPIKFRCCLFLHVVHIHSNCICGELLCTFIMLLLIPVLVAPTVPNHLPSR
jgi:hypothetical protein